MKLSKSKLALAKVINENGGWDKGHEWNFSTCDRYGVISFWDDRPVMLNTFLRDWRGEKRLNLVLIKPLPNWHQCVLSREEYYQAYPKADADGWIEWKGGECPVGKGTLVDVKYANGIINFGVSAMTNRSDANHVPGTAVSFTASNWGGDLPLSGIIAYRLHKPDVKPEFCESVTRSIPEPESKPTIEQLAADYRNQLEFANRKQAEADDAKADADAALARLERAGDALGLLIGIAKPEPKLVITDWRKLRVGDVVEITGSDNGCWEEHSGMEMTVENVYPDDGDDDVQVDLLGESGAWSLGGNTTWRFIRRP